MLHDGILGQQQEERSADRERRRFARTPFTAELVVVWVHDTHVPVRLRVCDISKGGYRVRSSSPLMEGMAGIVLRLLPAGTPLNQTVTVAWSRQAGESDEFEAGLSVLGEQSSGERTPGRGQR